MPPAASVSLPVKWRQHPPTPIPSWVRVLRAVMPELSEACPLEQPAEAWLEPRFPEDKCRIQNR